VRTYALRRLLLFVPTLVGASLLIFVLMRLVPGDIAEILVYQTGSEASREGDEPGRPARCRWPGWRATTSATSACAVTSPR
jgi:peptide/nickel transport system permease protein